MKKETIQIIIVLMSVALIGITIIQFMWLRETINLNEQNFDANVLSALTRVRDKIEESANSLETVSNYFQPKSDSPFKVDNDPITELLNPAYKYSNEYQKIQLGNIAWRLNPEVGLKSISISDLDRDLKKELSEIGVTLHFDYGIYSNTAKSYIIMNGNHMVNIGNPEQSSDGGEIKSLDRTTHQVSLFSVDDNEPAGSLRVFFPRKTTYLLSSVMPSLISSFVFTGLILFCFIYTITVILRQKKVSLMKTDFINNMTHEFKTPIATISLAADSINNPKIQQRPDQIKRYADIIKQENKRMLNQVEKVLNIARLDRKDFELKLIDVDLNELVNTAVEHSALKVNQRGGFLKAILKAQNSVVKGDENHISNVIHNLLDNADKYSLDKPYITLETRDVKDGVEILITDRGIGMTKDDLKRIFEKFYRVSTGNLHDVKGFGLGLSYVKAIMEAHKGKVSVFSEIGKGSTFTLYFRHNKVTFV